jgi:hypothetical protein
LTVLRARVPRNEKNEQDGAHDRCNEQEQSEETKYKGRARVLRTPSHAHTRARALSCTAAAHREQLLTTRSVR